MKNTLSTHLFIDALSSYDTIVFAIVFGSQCRGKTHFGSDIDIGVWFRDSPDLLMLGEIIAQLENTAQGSIDLVVLNDLYHKNPLLAYNITGNHTLLINRDPDLYERFKYNSYLYYFDFAPVIEAQNHQIRKELRDGVFGKAKRAE